MVQNNGEDQSPGSGSEPLILDGARQDSQPGASGDGGTTQGAGDKPVRTYSEAEVASIQSALDKRISEANNISGRLAMELTNERVARAENAARAADAKLVDDGELSQEGAVERAKSRQTLTQEALSLQQERAQLQEAYVQTEDKLRIVAADELAREHGIDRRALLSDATMTPQQMENKARELALDKREASMQRSETFDGGGGAAGAGSGSLDNMSPEEKIAYGLAHPPRRR